MVESEPAGQSLSAVKTKISPAEVWERRISGWRKEYSTQDFISVRSQAEAAARDLLKDKLGRFEENDLRRFLGLCNTEFVPGMQKSPVKTRFRFSFMGQNVNLMIDSIDQFNKWIARLWSSSATRFFQLLDEFWKADEVKGAGTGLPTMVAYLKDPETYNVWLVSMNTTLHELTGVNVEKKRSGAAYRNFNEVVNEQIRKRYSLKPQEIDFVLTMVGGALAG